MSPALVVGTHTMGLGVIRALGSMGVPVVAIYYDPEDMGYASRYAIERRWAPHPELEEDAFLAFLERQARRWAGGMLTPASDEALKTISKYKEALGRDFVVACPDWEVTRQILEKDRTAALAAQAGVAAPRTARPGSEAEAVQAGEALGFPCLVKPVESHRYQKRFGRKMAKAENRGELARAYREAEAAGLGMVVQELIPGEDRLGVIYNAYCWEGRPLAEFTARKIRNAPPGLGSPCAARSEAAPEAIEAGRRLLGRLGYSGFSCMEFKQDPRDGRLKLMEVNGRHNLSGLLAVRAGVNFPWIEYQLLVEGVTPEQQGAAWQEGLYWIDLERDLAYLAQRLARLGEGPGQLLEPYLRPHVYAVFEGSDLRPFIKRWFDCGRRLARRARRFLRGERPGRGGGPGF